ncbi:toprim domain-containing protein [Aeromonas veronii]|uniref:toprim domain-containing protein n=1 Tax=Aeromonas veronii TaxID=654 RepID=UPI003BA1446C
MEAPESEFIGKEPCPSCGSRDNLARYSDGHAWCFGCNYREPADGETHHKADKAPTTFKPVEGEYRTLKARGITAETCKKYGYKVGLYSGDIAQISDVRDVNGKLVGQKVRRQGKEFAALGDVSKTLIGCHLFSGGNKLVITEGEIDMLTMSQLNGNKYPVVSIPLGAKGAKKAIAANLDYLSNFEEIVLCFDMDDVGIAATQEVAEILIDHNVKIMRLPLKDPNEMLLAGRVNELINALWNASEFVPDGLVDIDELFDEAVAPVEMGSPWFLPQLTKATYGRRAGELYGVGAGTGMGKTDWFTQQIAFDAYELDEKVAVFYLEQAPKETLRRIIGKHVGEALHVPAIHRTKEYMMEKMFPCKDMTKKNVQFYDNFGVADWGRLKSKIVYLATRGYKKIFIDHLTALATGGEKDEKTELENIMADMAGVAKRYGLIIHFISHLATPEGKPHEEGGRVTIRHFKGSRAIGFWSYFLFALERNQQSDDEEERTTTTFRILKDRFTGQATGQTILLGYDEATGRLYEKHGEAEAFKEEPVYF